MDESERLPAASRMSRLTWTRSTSLTRLEFHGTAIQRPASATPSESVLRLDFTAVDASEVPSRLDVGTNEVSSILRIPERAGILPEGVSARFLVMLAQPGQSYTVETSMDKVTVFIGVDEKARGGGLVLRDTSMLGAAAVAAASASRGGARTERPLPEDVLPRSLAFVLPGEQAVRASPSAVSAEVGWARAGETKLADARRGDWIHVVGGGWLRLPERTADAPAVIPSGTGGVPAPASPQRTPAAWSVVTLGTGLQADVEEVLPGSPGHEGLSRLFRQPIRIARLIIRVQGGQFSFQLPPKRGRIQVTLPGDRLVESLDPRDMDATDDSAAARIAEIIDAPSIGAGDLWETVVFFPGDLDFLQVERMRLDIGGMQHGLFRIPGSGDRVPEENGAP